MQSEVMKFPVILVLFIFLTGLPAHSVAEESEEEKELRDLAELVRSFPEKGRKPEKLPVFGIMGEAKPAAAQGRAAALRNIIAKRLGSNTVPDSSLPARNQRVDLSHVATKDLAVKCEELKKAGRATRLRVVIIADRLELPDGPPNDAAHQAFGDFLEEQGVDPARFGLRSLHQVPLDWSDKESQSYYLSNLFRAELAIRDLKKRSDIVREQLPDVDTTIRYSCLPNYRPTEWQWARAFKREALTLPWADDFVFKSNEASPQVIGYMMAALRCGALYHNSSIGWTARPNSPGNTPAMLRRSFYTALGHGARIFDFGAATPPAVAISDNHISIKDKEMWQTVCDLVHETGQIEHVIQNARPRAARVGILLSFAQDLYETGTAYNHERKCLYMTLRQTAFTSDIITEEDIKEGKHTGLKVIYIVGNHLERATAEELRHWVQGGGILASFAGGGFFDENNRPMDTLNEVYGLESQQLQMDVTDISTKGNLPKLKPIDRVRWVRPREEFDVYGAKQIIKPLNSAKVHAKFSDGSPAVIENTYGQGRAFLFGSLFASSYFKDAIPDRDWQNADDMRDFLPTQFNGQLTDIIALPCSSAELSFEYLLNDTSVEVMILESPDAIAMVFVNWSAEPVDLRFSIEKVQPIYTRMTSAKQGQLDFIGLGRSASFKIRIDVADVVLLEK